MCETGDQIYGTPKRESKQIWIYVYMKNRACLKFLACSLFYPDVMERKKSKEMRGPKRFLSGSPRKLPSLKFQLGTTIVTI